MKRPRPDQFPPVPKENVVTLPTHNPEELHFYEFGILITQPGDRDGTEFTTVFISRYASQEDADTEALDAAHRWGTNIHQTCGNTLAMPGWDVHVRQGQTSVCWYNESETKLEHRKDYRFVGKAKIA